jgi:hypothetical protein
MKAGYSDNQGRLDLGRPQVEAMALVHPASGGIIVDVARPQGCGCKKVEMKTTVEQLCGVNPNRKTLLIYNGTGQTVYLKLHDKGQPKASADDYSTPLLAGERYEPYVPHTGEISAYTAAAGGVLRVTEGS